MLINILFRRGILVLFVCLMAVDLQATTRKVLFIGNSYTYTNNMPLMLQTLAAALGDTLIYDESDPGGYTLEQHSTYAPTISKIFSRKWDIVVLQEQSELPAFPPDQVDTQVYPYAHALDSMVGVNDSCTQTMFMMTWGHADGDPANCAFYPVICTYNGMQQRLRESYMQMTLDNNAIVAPVGVAWKEIRDSFPALWLYQSDSDHPVVTGSYLEACVLYSSIFHKSTFGCTYTDGLAAADAHTLQRMADKVVLDSIHQWQQYGHYPYAGFNHTLSGTTATFSDIPVAPLDHYWRFGDGADDTAADPVHSYAANGNYIVSHSASTNCFSETITDTIHINITTVQSTMRADEYPVGIRQNGNGNVTFVFPETSEYDVLEVFDVNGKCVRRYPVTGTIITDTFVPGFYVYHATSNHGRSYRSKLVVY